MSGEKLYYDNGSGTCFNWCGGDFDGVACYVEGSCRGYTAQELEKIMPLPEINREH